MKLTATKFKSLPPGKLHCDGNGLYIHLRTLKSGNWSFKYMRGHKSCEMGLGPYPIPNGLGGELEKQGLAKTFNVDTSWHEKFSC